MIGDWEIHANGRRGTLRIRSIDQLGRVSGRMFDQRITGWWNERGRRLTFALAGDGTDSSDGQGFEGYAWDEPADLGLQRSYHLAGSYDTFGGGGGAKDRQSFGWFATLVRPGPAHISEAP
jgi:hypothetical protein